MVKGYVIVMGSVFLCQHFSSQYVSALSGFLVTLKAVVFKEDGHGGLVYSHCNVSDGRLLALTWNPTALRVTVNGYKVKLRTFVMIFTSLQYNRRENTWRTDYLVVDCFSYSPLRRFTLYMMSSPDGCKWTEMHLNQCVKLRHRNQFVGLNVFFFFHAGEAF